jgi:hypothetical protein
VQPVSCALFAILASPQLDSLAHLDLEFVAFAAHDEALSTTLQVPDLTGTAVGDCLTDVDHSFSIHAFKASSEVENFPVFYQRKEVFSRLIIFSL